MEKTLSECIKERYDDKGMEKFLLDFAEDFASLLILLVEKKLVTREDLRPSVRKSRRST